MSYDFDNEYGNDNEQSGPKALRDQLEKLKSQLAEKDKELGSLREANTALETKVKSSTLRDAFADAGIDAKYARFAERDGVEPTKEAVEKWREENAEVYAFLAQKPAAEANASQGEQEEEPQAPVADNVSPAFAALLAQAQGLESSGHPSGSTDIVNALEGIDPNKVESREQLVELLGALGAPLD